MKKMGGTLKTPFAKPIAGKKIGGKRGWAST